MGGPKKKMLILRGNSGPDYPDECGISPAKPPYEKGNDPEDKQSDKHFGALHDNAALAYASAAGYQGFVLNVSGNAPDDRKLKRDQAPQTAAAVTKLIADDSFKAIYGFSGGGYDVYWVLRALKTQKPEVLSRIERIVVLGVDDDAPKTKFDPKNIEVRGVKLGWTMENVDYQSNSDVDKSVVPKGDGKHKGARIHMFGPESLLKKTFPVDYEKLMKEEPYDQCPLPLTDKKTDNGTKPHKGH